MNCLMRSWTAHEGELRAWLRGRLGNAHDAEDMLQDLFIKAMRQDKRFCEIANARAWLYEVARNALADRLRLEKEQVELPDDLVAEHDEPAAVESLATCLPRALSKLAEEDRDAITRCDLDGMTQEAYAHLKGLTLPGAKSRVQRARRRLREELTRTCNVRFDQAGNICCHGPGGRGSE